jgi:hypothetical protein
VARIFDITRENFTIQLNVPDELENTVYQKGQPRAVAPSSDVLPAISNACSTLDQPTDEEIEKLLA